MCFRANYQQVKIALHIVDFIDLNHIYAVFMKALQITVKLNYARMRIYFGCLGAVS